MHAPKPPTESHILVIDDEPDLRTLYELTLLREGYRVDTAATLAEALQQLTQAQFDVIITDMRLPDGLGLELLQWIQMQRRPERAIVITAYGSAENAVEALKAGAFDYLTKPVDLRQFRTLVASAVRQLPRTPAAWGSQTAAPGPGLAGPCADPAELGDSVAHLSATGQQALARLVGNSSAMCHVKRRIAKIARSMAPVLVRGESGTGKELIARAIHDCSHRSDGPFVAVNCGAIPENLLEAEFFGAKKGSYTGSTQDRLGYFQAARQGTLFLDEIGDLPLAMQSKLLRAIQERKVRALGSTQEEAADVRIVSATHKDLAVEVQAGRFRQDLYYRLNVIEIISPPLRERREDLAVLCTALLARIAHDSGAPVPQLSPQALAQLQNHPLAGNVRELENLLHRAVALSDGELLDFEDLELPAAQSAGDLSAPVPTAGTAPAVPPPDAADTPADALPLGAAASPGIPQDLQAWLDHQEREMLIRALQTTDYNRTAAAALLGLNLRQIRYRMSRLAIVAPGSAPPDFDDSISP